VSGPVQSVAQVAARFAAVWGRLAGLADVPTRAREPLAKAQRLAVQWLAPLAFFWASVQTRGDALDLAPDVEQAVLTQLIPALDLERVAGRSRHRLTALSAPLLEPLRQPTHPRQALAPTTRQQMEGVAASCADRFQRSSSYVEGRNGHLSRYHHGARCERWSYSWSPAGCPGRAGPRTRAEASAPRSPRDGGRHSCTFRTDAES
jgi:hypothetical protein